MVNHPWEYLYYHLDMSPHFSYMILQTPIFYHKIFSIGVIFFLLIYFLCTPLHGLAFYSLNYSLCFFPHISTMPLYIFQPNFCYYLSYVSSTSIYKVELLHKLTTEHTLHSRVKISITQNLNCYFPKIVES